MAALTLARAFASWEFTPLVSGVLALLATAYLAGVWLAARRQPTRPWPLRRTLAFLLGLATVAAATQGSPAVYDDVLLSAHMVQHLLLIMVAPPLLILGRPVTLLLRVARTSLRNRLKHVLRSRLVSALTWPPAAAALYAAVVIGTHLTPLMNLVLENTAVHESEHAIYLVTGYLYFLSVIGTEPIRWRPTLLSRFLLLLATMPVDTLVGVVLMLASRQLFPAYRDLHQGGLVMLAGGDLIMTVLAVGLAVSIVQGHSTPRGDGRRDLDAYNTYLASLDSHKVRLPRGEQEGARPDLYAADHDGGRVPGPERAGLLPRPAVARGGSRSRRRGQPGRHGALLLPEPRGKSLEGLSAQADNLPGLLAPARARAGPG